MGKPNSAYKKLLEYQDRALGFQPGKGSEQPGGGEWAGVAFRIGETRLTCSLDRVSEFIPPPPITRVPGTKQWIMGLANVRGDLVTIIDLACFFHGKRSSISARTRLLSSTLRGRPVGLLVDEVFGQRSFVAGEDDGKSETPEMLADFAGRLFNAGQESFRELDLDVLFNTPEFLNGAAN